jgi:hypothetical protein
MVKKNDSDWNGPQGSADMGKDKLKKDSSGLGYHAPKSISRVIDPAADQDSGFSGKLPKGE